MLGARGGRCEFAKAILASEEFQASVCAKQPECVQARLLTFLCLNDQSCAGAVEDASDVDSICDAADAVSLFGNAALMDPAWCIGC